MKKLIVILASVVLVTQVSMAHGNGNGGNCIGKKQQERRFFQKVKNRRFMRIFRGLNLTKEQKREIFKIFQNSKVDIMAINKKYKRGFIKSIDENGFNKKKFIDGYVNRAREVAKVRAEVFVKAYGLLTKAQKEQLISKIDALDKK